MAAEKKDEKMHRFVKSVRVKTTFSEALRLADEVSEYFRSQYSTEALRTYVSSFGEVHSIFWEIDCSDDQCLSSPGAIEKMGSWVQGSAQDSESGVRAVKEALAQGRGSVSAVAKAEGKMAAYWIPDQYLTVAVGVYSSAAAAS